MRRQQRLKNIPSTRKFVRCPGIKLEQRVLCVCNRTGEKWKIIAGYLCRSHNLNLILNQLLGNEQTGHGQKFKTRHVRGVQRHNVHQAAASWRFHIAFPSLGSLIITSCIMPQLNYAILSFTEHFIQYGRNHFCRNVRFKKETYGKENKQTNQ